MDFPPTQMHFKDSPNKKTKTLHHAQLRHYSTGKNSLEMKVLPITWLEMSDVIYQERSEPFLKGQDHKIVVLFIIDLYLLPMTKM